MDRKHRWGTSLALTAIVLMTAGAIAIPLPLPRALVTLGVVVSSLAFGGYAAVVLSRANVVYRGGRRGLVGMTCGTQLARRS